MSSQKRAPRRPGLEACMASSISQAPGGTLMPDGQATGRSMTGIQSAISRTGKLLSPLAPLELRLGQALVYGHEHQRTAGLAEGLGIRSRHSASTSPRSGVLHCQTGLTGRTSWRPTAGHGQPRPFLLPAPRRRSIALGLARKTAPSGALGTATFANLPDGEVGHRGISTGRVAD